MTLLEKYIPQTWDEIIGQDEIKEILRKYERIEDLPHLMFIGASGIGKTAIAHVLAKSLGVPIIELNASDERGIDVIRDKVKNLLFTRGEKIVFLDEFDAMTSDAMHSLRRPMELSLQGTSRLIFTVNRPWKIIQPILSRTMNLYFKPLEKEALARIVLNVLQKEGVRFGTAEEAKDAIEMITTYARGDARRAINLIEKVLGNDSNNIIPILQREVVETDQIREVFKLAIEGKWEECLPLLENVVIQSANDSSEIIEVFWEGLENADIEPVRKFPLYKELADAERAIRLGCNPLIQLASFLMSVIREVFK